MSVPLTWLCLKADAIMRRDKPKDAYDVVWLIDALGPAEAAARIAASPLLGGDLTADMLVQLTRLISDQFRDTDAAGPEMYASFLGASGGDAERRHAPGQPAVGPIRDGGTREAGPTGGQLVSAELSSAQ